MSEPKEKRICPACKRKRCVSKHPELYKYTYYLNGDLFLTESGIKNLGKDHLEKLRAVNNI